jgi:hypothetical protein
MTNRAFEPEHAASIVVIEGSMAASILALAGSTGGVLV